MFCADGNIYLAQFVYFIYCAGKKYSDYGGQYDI